LWAEAVAAAAERPSPITAGFISSLNETIDLEGKRIESFFLFSSPLSSR
jgi:hypothetical protein